MMSFIGKKLDQSEEFDVIGQQVSYCRCPRAIYGIRHYVTPVQYNYGMLLLVLGNN